METETGREMGWFFDQWIRDTGYPVYRVYHTSSEGAGDAEVGIAGSGGTGTGTAGTGSGTTGTGRMFRVRGQLLQEQEGRVFHAVVPLVIELENGDRTTREIWNTKRRQTFEFTLPDRAKRIDIAPDFSVYFRAAR